MFKRVSPRAGLPVLLLIAAMSGNVSAQTPSAEQVQAMQRQLADWPQLSRYRDENAALAAPARGERRVVFFGDSITEGWERPGARRSSRASPT